MPPHRQEQEQSPSSLLLQAPQRAEGGEHSTAQSTAHSTDLVRAGVSGGRWMLMGRVAALDVRVNGGVAGVGAPRPRLVALEADLEVVPHGSMIERVAVLEATADAMGID